jgi:hypothetical protein
MTTDQDVTWRVKLAHNLLDNASDTIHQVAEEIVRDHTYDTQSLKTSLSLVQNALEYMLKFKLAWKDWRLVIMEPKAMTDALIQSGDFKTITFEDARKLLKNLRLVLILVV